MSITIVGLGPGDGKLLTREAWEILSQATDVHVRTARHPAVDDLPAKVKVHSFDEVYESAADFADVYAHIVKSVIQLGRKGNVVYAVPGHPFVGESTVPRIVAAAEESDIPVNIIEGLSFIEPMLTAIRVDGMDGVQIFDAIEMSVQDYPQLSADRPVVLGQVYSQMLASELKLTLNAIYPDEHMVQLVHAAGTAVEQVENVALYEIDRSESINHLTSLYLPPLPQKSDMAAFAAAIAKLRSPEGCPWDQKQTPQSMRAGFLEEVAEVLDAIDQDDVDGIREELGDVLLHITMQAQMAAEVGDFTLSDVIADIHAKIIRRHPHVWGNTPVDGSDDVEVNWDAIKAKEKAGKPIDSSVLANIPTALPALAQSLKIQSRVRKAGFDWKNIDGVYDKLQEEIAELKAAATEDEYVMELGDILFVVVNLANWLDLDAEIALREANLRFSKRFRFVEKLADQRQMVLTELDQDQLLDLWLEAKALAADY